MASHVVPPPPPRMGGQPMGTRPPSRGPPPMSVGQRPSQHNAPPPSYPSHGPSNSGDSRRASILSGGGGPPPQNVNDCAPRGESDYPRGPSQGHPQGPPQGHPQGPPQGHPQGHPQGPPQGHAQGPPQGPPQGHPQGPPQGHPQSHPQCHPQGPPQGHPQGPPQGHPQGPPQGHPQGPPQGHPQSHPQGHDGPSNSGDSRRGLMQSGGGGPPPQNVNDCAPRGESDYPRGPSQGPPQGRHEPPEALPTTEGGSQLYHPHSHPVPSGWQGASEPGLSPESGPTTDYTAAYPTLGGGTGRTMTSRVVRHTKHDIKDLKLQMVEFREEARAENEKITQHFEDLRADMDGLRELIQEVVDAYKLVPESLIKISKMRDDYEKRMNDLFTLINQPSNIPPEFIDVPHSNKIHSHLDMTNQTQVHDDDIDLPPTPEPEFTDSPTDSKTRITPDHSLQNYDQDQTQLMYTDARQSGLSDVHLGPLRNPSMPIESGFNPNAAFAAPSNSAPSNHQTPHNMLADFIEEAPPSLPPTPVATSVSDQASYLSHSHASSHQEAFYTGSQRRSNLSTDQNYDYQQHQQNINLPTSMPNPPGTNNEGVFTGITHVSGPTPTNPPYQGPPSHSHVPSSIHSHAQPPHAFPSNTNTTVNGPQSMGGPPSMRPPQQGIGPHGYQ